MGKATSERAATNIRDRGLYTTMLLLVLLSGFAALVYELLWFRQLGFVFGNTVQAAATVLTAFMAGLAWGASVAPRWVARARNPLKLFAAIEAGIGVYALLAPAAFTLASAAYQTAARNTEMSAPMLIGLRFLLALLVLAVPTMLMGASLPVLAEAGLRSRKNFATRLGLLYGCNTAGATLGVLACGFILLPQLGVTVSNFLAASTNFIVGGVAFWLARRAPAGEGMAVEAGSEPEAVSSSRMFGWLVIAALCGALALAFETVWFRALVLILGSTSYSFAIMVASFLLGIALGSATLGWLANRSGRAIWLVAGSLAGIGLWTLVSVQLYNSAPELFLELVAGGGFTWTGILGARAALGAIFLLPLALFSGLAFTCVVRLIRERAGSAGRAVGAAFSANALGSAVGAALAGFALLPALGLEKSLLVLSSLSLLIAVAVPWVQGVTWRPWLAFTGSLVLIAAGVRWFSSTWDPLLLSSGPYFAVRENVQDGEVILRQRLETIELVYYRESATSTVDVKRSADGRLYFSSDGKVEADTSPESMVLQRAMGHLPMLFHPEPRRVLNIGLGAGVTAGALTCYPGAEIEVVDIEPAVKEIAALWSARNHELIKQGKFKFLVNDGRNHLLVTTNRYDVITSDPFEPVVAGAASLYTVDHFQLARSRLAPNGMMAQFLPLYELSQADLLIILRSFLRVFPRSCVFFTGSDTVLLGLTGDADLRLQSVVAKMAHEQVRDSLAEIGIDRPERLLNMLVMNILPGNATIPDGMVNTDDRPVIEFSAPKSALDYRPDVNQEVLLNRFEPIPAHYLAELSPEAAAETRRGHEGLRSLLMASLLRSRGDYQGNIKLLRQAFEQAPKSPIIRNELGQSLVLAADEAATPAEAAALCAEALRLNPKDFWAVYKLTFQAISAKDWVRADEYLAHGLEFYPEAALLMALRGQRLGGAGDVAGACKQYERVVKKLPKSSILWTEYAGFLELAGRVEEARAASQLADKLRRGSVR